MGKFTHGKMGWSQIIEGLGYLAEVGFYARGASEIFDQSIDIMKTIFRIIILTS